MSPFFLNVGEMRFKVKFLNWKLGKITKLKLILHLHLCYLLYIKVKNKAMYIWIKFIKHISQLDRIDLNILFSEKKNLEKGLRSHDMCPVFRLLRVL